MNTRVEQAKAKVLGKLNGLGLDSNKYETLIADTVISKYAEDFSKLLSESIKNKKVTDTGTLESSIRIEYTEDGKGFRIYLEDYYDYPNKGVKGVDSGTNAPGSPYQYKNYGMNAQGRSNIKRLIASGKAKVSDTSKTKYAVGLETKKISSGKKKSLIDMQVDQLIYLIKKYGIKKTGYFDEVVKVVFKDFKEVMAAAYGEDAAQNIKLILKGS
jgi:hypothetical protein